MSVSRSSSRRTPAQRLILFFVALATFDVLIWTAVALTR